MKKIDSYPIVVLFVLIIGCGDNEPAQEPGISRVAKVEAINPIKTPEKWCDKYFSDLEAPILALPDSIPVSSGSGIVREAKGEFVWLNLWATWCAPCLNEIPLIERWQKALVKYGLSVSLWFLTIDEEREQLDVFLKSHPSFARRNSVRMKKPEELGNWLKTVGLAESSTIPINILTDRRFRVRCIRTGAIAQSDFAVVRHFFFNMSQQ